MIKHIKRLIFAWNYKQAVKEAAKQAEVTGLRYYVILLNGRLKVVPKKTIKELIKNHRFRKGTTLRDIEKRALFITK